MTAPIISISSGLSEESVGSRASRVILCGAILAIIPEVPIVLADPLVAPDVGTISVVSPARVLDLVDYSSSSDSDPSEDSLPPVPDLPLVSPFLCSDNSEADDSSSSSSPSDHSLSGHAPPDTTDADASALPRFIHRSLFRTPRRSEAFRRWRPSRKRCRSPTALHNKEEHIEVDTADAEADVDVGIYEGVVAHPEDSIDMGYKFAASDVREDYKEFKVEASVADTREIAVDPLAIGDSFESSKGGIPDLEDTIYDIVHYMSEVHIDRITEIETTQRQLVASGERASLVERIMSLRLEYLKVRRDRDDTQRRLRRLESYNDDYHWLRDGDNGNGDNGNGENGNAGNGNPNKNGRGVDLTIRVEVAFAMSWRELIKLMTEVYYPRNEIQKMESELWNLTVKNNDLAAYTQRFQELTMILQDAVRIDNNLMDQKLKGYAVKNAKNKRRLEVNQRDNHGQQPPFKRPNRSQVVNQRVLTCFECGKQGHFRSDCLKLKDQNHGNKAGNKNGVGEARGKAYVLGGRDAM
ncbi:putative reverse transcriptase domain-containing protein [Tanacetum coccineum]